MAGKPLRGARFVRSLIPAVMIAFTVGLDQLATAALVRYLVPAVADLPLPDLGLPVLDLLRAPLPLPLPVL
ncbi:hypothetical protein D187_006693 [Cystobacter fuscus DSM 2262]|uniref:Uncharacterized protein n=1 Tax=Cystobacter fuscus (strain ATCC 25194 / DSM 2262 / NBRC 100088 / M29) TaxID=1242864 RepID=S9NXI7_CYSF2|nr:hypothetical protein [Cystobacter fuscus]EPX56940.1 hypothetical protein D187_006693 [Cystobacter fuscus DSM 2262]